jgi:thiol-disulfide isomerase/thioredoxin
MAMALLLACALSSQPREASAAEVAAAFAPGGRPRLVHIWATWCAPCRAELQALLPELRRRKGLAVTFLSLDEAAKAPEAAMLLARNGGAPGESLRAGAPEALAAIRGFDRTWDGSLPTNYLLSPEGRLLLAQRGLTELGPLLSEVDKALKRTTTRRGRR